MATCIVRDSSRHCGQSMEYKLIVQDTTLMRKPTGVTLSRKYNNLVHSFLLPVCSSPTVSELYEHVANNRLPRRWRSPLLTLFAGTCSKGPQCRYIHDPTKVAICLDFLRTGQCQAGPDCDLSHDPTPERVPACLHFLRGNCTKDDCRYAHVRVNPGAPVCRAFATLGYCPKGAACPERHVHECPDYANKGLCRNKHCRLPHVDRAGQLRKAAAAKDGERNASETASDISSDDDDAEYDEDDVDSDEFDEEYFIPSAAAAAHELSQQTDFVKF
jgi:hypothetical protein